MSDIGSEDTRRGPAFVVKVVIIVAIALAALAVAGDDELRATLASWAKSPDRWWR